MAGNATWTAPASTDPEQACPIGPVVDIVFSRWTTPILWSLNMHGRQRFVELERRITKITPKVLTQRLRQLERDGLIVRTYHPEVPLGSSTRSPNSAAALPRSSPISPNGPPPTSTASSGPGTTTTPIRPGSVSPKTARTSAKAPTTVR